MTNTWQHYRLGIWTVKQEKIPEFIAAWRSSADWIGRDLDGGGEGILLQDADRPTQFVSFASSVDLEAAQVPVTSLSHHISPGFPLDSP